MEIFHFHVRLLLNLAWAAQTPEPGEGHGVFQVSDEFGEGHESHDEFWEASAAQSPASAALSPSAAQSPASALMAGGVLARLLRAVMRALMDGATELQESSLALNLDRARAGRHPAAVLSQWE